MRILVSACLLGCACRYDGGSKPCEKVLALAKDHALVPFCPEQAGGLTTPRMPAEIREGRVLRKDGADVTAQYERGASEALRLYEALHCDLALLKARSPSCGSGKVYDGAFSGHLIEGDGITARLLKKKGIRVLTEEDLPCPDMKDGFFTKD